MMLNVFHLAGFLIFVSFHKVHSDDVSCQEMFTYGYGYQQFIHLPRSSYLENGTIMFKFSVMARSDAHILLSPHPAPNHTDPVYEIVLGAGRNTFSDIRRLRKASSKATSSTKNILSEQISQTFMIKINNGLISVEKEGLENAFLFWRDLNPLDIRYISFCTWSNVVGKWSFDCKGTEVIQRQLNKVETLQKYLLSNYDPYTIPITDDNILNIDASLLLNYINLDEKKLSMTLQGTFQFSWFDTKLQWFPSDYGNVSTLHLTHRRIWLPEFILFNALGDGSTPMGKSTWVVVSNEGEVKWTPSVNLETRCNLNLTNWPWDEHNCDVKLGLYTNQDSIDINISNNISRLKVQKTGSNWEITTLLAETTLIKVPWQDDISEEPDEMGDRKTALVLNVGLKRKSESYRLLLFLPLFVAVTMILCSLWLSLMSFERILLNCTSILLLIMFLLTNDSALPALTKDTPHILLVYSRVLLVATTCTTVSILLTYIARKDHLGMPPQIICKILRSIFFKAIPWLSSEGKYGHLGDNDSGNLVNSNEWNTEEYWDHLTKVMNSLAFVVFLAATMIAII